MRTLVLFRGAPGCGKSTYIKDHGLEPYTISSDTVRLLYSSPELKIDGSFGISQKQDQAVWNTINSILESRFERGEFTVLDSTNSKTEDMRKLRTLAEKYRYRVFLVDMTGVPIEVALRQNKLREPSKVVPEYAIRNIYERFKTETVPSGIEVIKPDELSKVFIKQETLNYRKIVHFGDIHGCYSTLMKYFEANPMSDDTYYIFVGDYLDRGNENVETYKFIESIKDKPNVCLLEGNHERWINHYGNGLTTKSDEFNDKTKPQLEAAGITQKSARQLYRKFRQMIYYSFKTSSKTYSVFVCHGGIPSIGTYQNRERHITCTPTFDMIHGVGSYPEYKDVAAYWMTNTAADYLIHGHRNTENDDIEIADRVFNLEGGVEFGGELRIVELDSKGFHPIKIRSCQPIKEGDYTEKIDPEKLTMAEAIAILRNNRFIRESKLGDGISSFNFSKAAFYEANWNKQTVIARGLFIDTKNEKIIARSYEKFFRINETTQTSEANLKENLKFPITAYRKENGFLGLISYDYRNDGLFISSKSTTSGEFVGYFKNILAKYDTEKIKSYLKEHPDYTMVFEVIDPINDPHIVEYSESKIVLLDLIKNSIKFEKAPYCVLSMVGDLCDLEVKEQVGKFSTWEEFEAYYKQITSSKDERFEGVVVEDDTGFMFKVKTKFYSDIKKLRGIAYAIYTYGKYMHESKLTESERNFTTLCTNYYRGGGATKPDHIIGLLKQFNLY